MSESDLQPKMKPGDVLHSSPGNAFVLLADGETFVRISPKDKFIDAARKTVWQKDPLSSWNRRVK